MLKRLFDHIKLEYYYYKIRKQFKKIERERYDIS